jgi:ribokinase
VRVVAVGNANVDLLLYVDEVPAAGQQVEARAFERRPGGAAANFAVAAAKLGASSALLCCVGLDGEGEWLLRELERQGVDTSLALRAEAPTGFSVVIVDGRGERAMVAHRGANALLNRAVELLAPPLRADWVHAASVKPDVAEAALSAAKRLGATTSYDPGGAVARMGFERLAGALKHADVLFLNEEEAAALAGSGGGRGLERVGELVRVVVLKRGARGSAAWLGGSFAEAPAFKVEVVDTTGAGDAFDAAFALALSAGAGLQEALIFANACAGLKVSRRGAQSSPTLAEALEFLRSAGLAELASKLAKAFNRWAGDGRRGSGGG